MKTPIKFIILLGIVSLFADMTYEGARSINGAYLATLGASAAIVGLVAGFGELIGYSLRLVSGYLADRTQRYWLITAIGYLINLLAVPLLALTEHWPLAAMLMIAERFGKSIRVPARDAMLSHAGEEVGMGWAFGLHQALDQIGAMLGPLVVAGVLFFHEGYQYGYAILAIPAVLALLALYFAYRRFPTPHQLGIPKPKLEQIALDPSFKLFLIGSSLIGMGYADFSLIAYHFEKTGLLGKIWIPLTYGIAMGVDALSAPFLGRLYDRHGFIVLICAVTLSAFFAPLVFLGNTSLACLGVILWAVGMGVQDSLLRSVVGQMAPKHKKASIFGLFNMVYGLCWFLGSAAMGMIYDYSIVSMVVFIVLLQLSAIPFFIGIRSNKKGA